MKAILKFDLNDESHEHLVAVHGADTLGLLWDVDQQLLLWQNHGHNFKSADEAIEAIADMIRTRVDEDGLRGIFK